MWYEGDAPHGFVNAHDEARFTMQASRVATTAAKTVPAFEIIGLKGQASILTTHIDDRLVVSGDGAGANVLGLGLLREYNDSDYLTNTTAPPARIVMASGRQRTKLQGRLSPGTLAIRDRGTVDPEFVRQMLADARADVLPSPLTALPTNVSDVRMFRVWAGGGLNNITIRP
jgi:hypothetical protein